MHVAFRVDASPTIGAGHVMRCLTLADSLVSLFTLHEKDITVTFVTTESAGMLNELIVRSGYQCLTVSSIDSNIDHVSAELWVIDHYQLDGDFEAHLMLSGAHVIVIDDLANRHHQCHLLLDGNLVRHQHTRYNSLVPLHCKRLLGPKYALLRQEFYAAPVTTDVVKKDNHLLVCFGGSDPANLTSLALDAIDNIKDTALSADVVIGSGHPAKSEIMKRVASMPSVVLHIDSSDMSTLMRRASLMIGAGGSMHWERCVMRLPAVIITIADNQVETTTLLASLSVCHYLGHVGTVSPKDIATAITSLLFSPQTLDTMAKNANKVIPQDGGASLVCSEIVNHLALLK